MSTKNQMIDREKVDDALQRIALAAFIYYPEVRLDEPAYQVDQDVEWCMYPLTDLSTDARATLRELIPLAIVDPSAHRQEAFAALIALSEPRTHR
ncbi:MULTISPECIES: hypothetical protein [unclassified Microbacterium]|uniref:hypothetical protein n=1 Tax=unclassified Microbacterium TaxID=2609290 RepID=UPI000C2C036F|nr:MULTISPECIES: hypothetical protein [unclassified Microbacterium]